MRWNPRLIIRALCRLHEMERFKRQLCRHLFHSEGDNNVKLEVLLRELKDLELKVRSCYRDGFKHITSDDFVKMMLIDGCFVIELIRECVNPKFEHEKSSIKRWMLPVLRRDLIKLENQLPFFVLEKLFYLTARDPDESSLQEKALSFFKPLFHRDFNTVLREPSGIKGKHFLDLFRSSILPRAMTHGKESRMMRSITELKEAGIVVKVKNSSQVMDVYFDERVLFIPPLCIDDYKGTLFRNMVAFEQWHGECKPDISSYLFFFDGLINSADDIELLHYKGIIYHSLGNNKEVAKLVNNLCKDVARDINESYLHTVVWDANHYCDTTYAHLRAVLVHHYFSNWVVGISTIVAVFALYLTIIQTGSSAADVLQSLTIKSYGNYVIDTFLLPFFGPLQPEEKESEN